MGGFLDRSLDVLVYMLRAKYGHIRPGAASRTTDLGRHRASMALVVMGANGVVPPREPNRCGSQKGDLVGGTSDFPCILRRVTTLCLVPTPLRARRMARRLCDAERGLLFGPRVVTPEELVPGLLAGAGESRPLLTPLAERLLAVESCRAAGGPWTELSPGGGLSRALAGAIGELRRGEVTAEVLREVAGRLEGRAQERLSALAAVLAQYESKLTEEGLLDRAAGLRTACEALRHGGRSSQIGDLGLLVIEGFHTLSPGALELVSWLARRARRSLFRLPYLPERPELSAPAEPLVRRIEAWHELSAEREMEIAFPRMDGRAPRLVRLLSAVRGGAAAPLPEGAEGRVLGLEAPDEEGEWSQVARLAAELLEQGFAPDDILLFAASPAQQVAGLRRACAARGVPLACGRGSPLGAAGPVRALRAVLQAVPRLNRATAEVLAGSTYLGLPAPARLGHWLERAGAVEGRGDPEQLLRARAARLTAAGSASERSALVRSADWMRHLNDLLRPLGPEATARHRAQQLRGLIQVLGIRRCAVRAESEATRRDLVALLQLEETAEAVAEGLALLGRGGERLRLDRWLPLFDLAIDSKSLPVPGEPAAGAVELWPLAEAPGLEARAAILMGCGQSWPPGHGPEPVLREPERIAVNRLLKRSALATWGARRAEADYQGLCAMAAGRELVAFTWNATSRSALLVEEALAAAGSSPEKCGSEVALTGASSEDDALRAAARLGRRGQGAAAIEALAAVSPRLAERARSAIERGRIESLRREALQQRRTGSWVGALPSPLLPGFLQALPEEWSPTLLETWAGCPYRLFVALVLKVPEREAAEVEIGLRDEGSLAHLVMERLLEQRRARGAWPFSGSEADKAEARSVAGEVFGAFEAAGRVGDPTLWAARRELVLARLDRIVEAEAQVHDGLAPQLLEHRFGGGSGHPPLVFEDGGEQVRLKGRIDRVDADGDRLLVLDYKNSKNKSELTAQVSEEALGVTSFQLPAYVLAAAQALPGRSRLQAGYALLRSAERVKPWTIEAGHPFLAVKESKRAEVRESGEQTFADAVIAAVREIRRGQFPIASRNCSGCPYGAICRYQTAAEEEP